MNLPVLHDFEVFRHLHRLAAWDILPPRYAYIRRSVLAIKQKYSAMTRSQKSTLQIVAQQFSSMEEIVELSLSTRQPPDDVAGLNRTLSEQGDKLNAILTVIQGKIGV